MTRSELGLEAVRGRVRDQAPPEADLAAGAEAEAGADQAQDLPGQGQDLVPGPGPAPSPDQVHPSLRRPDLRGARQEAQDHRDLDQSQAQDRGLGLLSDHVGRVLSLGRDPVLDRGPRRALDLAREVDLEAAPGRVQIQNKRCYSEFPLKFIEYPLKVFG